MSIFEFDFDLEQAMAGRGNDVDYGSDEHAAATKIQAHFRGHQVRQQTGKRRSTEMQAHLLGGAEQAWGDDTDAVADFLQSIGMEQYTQTFYDNGCVALPAKNGVRQ